MPGVGDDGSNAAEVDSPESGQGATPPASANAANARPGTPEESRAQQNWRAVRSKSKSLRSLKALSALPALERALSQDPRARRRSSRTSHPDLHEFGESNRPFTSLFDMNDSSSGEDANDEGGDGVDGGEDGNRMNTKEVDLDDLMEEMDTWIKCSGLHTVSEWVLNYRKHPSCWGALLLMHGVPEVSGRLRAKVENYAIYSALFLSFTVTAVMNPPPAVLCEAREFDSEWDVWSCEVTRRISIYCLIAAVAFHFLAIILAMAFVNALNESAREADVFRMFARGQGFMATWKCQMAFRTGCGFTFMAMAAVAYEHLGWDVLMWIAILMGITMKIHLETAGLLFSSGSVVNYWRTELGGNPDPDDPYLLDVATHYFEEKLKFSRGNLGVPFEDGWPRADDGKTKAQSPTRKSNVPNPSEACSSSSAESNDESTKQAKSRKKKKRERQRGSYIDRNGQSIPQKGVAIF